MDSQEQSRFQERFQEQKGIEKSESIVCHSCSFVNGAEALYCEECGASLAEEKKCPKCHSKVSQNADICEACGHWLLDNKCKFCNSLVDPNEQYCGECGNPTAGITCPTCQHLSFFDFCPKCNTPLTEFAHEAIRQINNNPEMNQVQNLLQEIAQMEEEIKNESMILQQEEEEAKQQEIINKEEEERQKKLALLNSISSYIQTTKKDEPKTTTPPPPKQEVKRESLRDSLTKAKDIANKNIERARKNREAQEKLNGMKSLTFQNPQTARKFFYASKPPKTKGWLCVFADVLHTGPSECAEPHHGGSWIIES